MLAFPRRLAASLTSLAGAMIAALLFAQVAVVALRYVFSFGWPWSLDLLVYLFFLSVILPGFSVLAENRSVRVDLFYAGWDAGRRRAVDRAALAFLLFPALGYAAWASLAATANSWRILESSPTIGGLPGYFALKAALSAYLAGLALTALIMALRKSPYPGEGES